MADQLAEQETPPSTEAENATDGDDPAQPDNGTDGDNPTQPDDDSTNQSKDELKALSLRLEE
ncbi:hypothetical protein R0J89_21790, partial [Psychrobacter sp. SIMBA_152]